MFKYINVYTGELYHNLNHAVTTIVRDMIHYPKCRTIKMFAVIKYKEDKV